MKTALCLLLFTALGCSSASRDGSPVQSAAGASSDAGSDAGGNSASAGSSSSAGRSSLAGSGGATAGAAGNAAAGSNSAGAGGAASSGGAGGGGASGLPIPPLATGQSKPAGAAANLKILPWAGFKAAVSYTFDDGQPSHIEHWAELEATGIRGTFYLNTLNRANEPGFDATWQAAEAAGWELGNHTVHHCNADMTCSNGATFSTIDAEYDDVTAYIETTGKQPDVWTAAYPFGDTGWEPAAKSRFFLARGVGPGMIAPGDDTDPFNLPCYAAVAAGGEPASVFSDDIDGAHTSGKWLIFLFHSIAPTTQSWYATTDISSIKGSIQHAQALSDVWLDTLANVGAYWVGQKLLAAATPSSSAGVTTWSWLLPAHFPTGKLLRVTVDGGQLTQKGATLPWNEHGYYEVSLDAGTLSLSAG